MRGASLIFKTSLLFWAILQGTDSVDVTSDYPLETLVLSASAFMPDPNTRVNLKVS